MVFSRDFLQYWEKQAAENLLGLESSLLGQDGHELSYIVFIIISIFTHYVNREFSVTDSLFSCDFLCAWYNDIIKRSNRVMYMKQMLFILNPKAGTRKAAKVLVDILDIFNRAGYRVEVYVTEGPGDACSAIQKMAAGKDLVVCCGGDGTFNETVTGLMESGLDIPVGYLPAGSTNDFANSMNLSTDLLAAARQIVDGAPQDLDLGKFGDRYFSYVASFGAFSRTSYNTPQGIKNALGHTAYILSGIQELSQIRKIPMRFELDDEVLEDDFIFGAVCNSTSIGGILTLNPDQVDMGDGRFELLLVRAPRDLSEITECIMAVQKQQYNCRMMSFRTVQNAKIIVEKGLDWTLDGEKAEDIHEVSVQNLYHAIHLIK